MVRILLFVALILLQRYGRDSLRSAVFACLCVWSSYEAVCALMQVAGLSASHHAAFAMTGNFSNPGPLGGFVAVSLAVSLSYLVKYRRRYKGWYRGTMYALAAVSAFLGFMVLPASLSRGAWLSLAVVLVEILWSEGLLRKFFAGRRWLILPVTLLVLLSVASVFYIKRDSAVGRIHIWHMELRAMAANPWGTGHGTALATYGKTQEEYFRAHLDEVPEVIVRVAGCPEYPFNEFLGTGMEYGWPGLMAALGVILGGTALLVRRRSIYAAGLVAWSVFALSSYPLSVPQTSVQLMVLLAAVVPAYRDRRSRTFVPAAVALGLLVATFIMRDRADFTVSDRSGYRELYNSGYSLYQSGEHARSNEELGLGAAISSDPMFHVIMGRNYEALGEYGAAREEYIRAYYMVPCRLYPLVRLMRMEIALGNDGDADRIGEKIVSMPVHDGHSLMRRLHDETVSSLDSLRAAGGRL